FQDEFSSLCSHSPPRSYPHLTLCSHLGQEWLHGVQAFMVLSLLFSSLAFIIFMWQLYTMKRGSLFYATGIFQILTAVSVFTAALIYTIHVDTFQRGRMPGGSYGHCFILAWLSFPLALISGIVYIHLRKKE
ncbi:hypothetical protein Chor_009380, partial [Crotalus horridus]